MVKDMIKNINIKNYKCFSNASLELKSANLLLGANSGGKSSIIQSILLSDIAINAKNEGIKSIDLTTNKYDLNLYGFDEVVSQNSYDDYFKFNILTDKSNFSIKYLPTDDENVVNVEFKDYIKGDRISDDLIYLSAERNVSINQMNGNIDNIKLGKSNEYIGYIIEKGKKKLISADTDRNFWENKETTFLDMQINNWLNYILPNNRVSAKNSGYDNHISLLFGDNINLHQTNIGYGVSFVLPIIIAGLIAKKDSLVIVENPELHLHPQAQSRIAAFLAVIAAAGVQIIIETHSEHIVNGFRKSIISDNIKLNNTELIINYFNIEEQSNIEKVILSNDAEITHWPDGFMDQEQKDLFEMRKMRLLNGRNCNNKK